MADEEVKEQDQAAAESETAETEASDSQAVATASEDQTETPAESDSAPEGDGGEAETPAEGDSAPEGDAGEAAADGDEGSPEGETASASEGALDAVENIESQLGEVLSNLEGLADDNLSGPAAGGGVTTSIELLRDVSLSVKIELGRSRMYIEDILKLNEGSIVELEKLAGDPVDVFVNDRLVARGEVLVLNDNFCVRIGEIVMQE